MILVILEHKDFKIKKSSFEAASFASELGSELQEDVAGLIASGAANLNELGKYGIKELYEFNGNDKLDGEQWTDVISQAYTKLQPKYIIMSNNSLGRGIGGRLAIRFNTGLISNVIQFNVTNEIPRFKKNVFSGKAFAWYQFKIMGGIVSIMPHGFGLKPSKEERAVKLNTLNISISDSKISLLERKLEKGKTPLTEADIVVSAGRGMKDASNWKMIEELADLLNATTACSRPVADAGWRPHHEHVGQTGIAIRPNVYIAIGISGAIQHLAGVNNSKNIVVINKDPEAPFFKAADYGICGDLFEVIPKLNEALRKVK